MRVTSLLMLTLLPLAACGGGAGEPIEFDQTASGAWTPPWRRDAGVRDTGVRADSGVRLDSGVRPDSGVPRDAGTIADSGVPRDAGTIADAGAGAATPWRPFTSDSPWNTRIPANPTLDPNSAMLADDLATSSSWPWLDVAISAYSVPIYWVDSSTPFIPVSISRVAGEWFHDNPSAPIPAGALPAAGTDGNLAIIDRNTGYEWDFWQARNTNGQWSCSVCAGYDTRLNGVRPHPQQSIPEWWMAHGIRACGYPLSAGLITVDEIRAGRIDHALVIGYPGIRGRYFKSPASTAQGVVGPVSPTEGMPCGTRIQLDPSINLDTLGLTPAAKTIARALQEYGAYVGDYNGSISLYADSSPTAQAAWSANNLLRTGDLRNKFDLRSFRVLEIGPLIQDAQ